VYVQDITYGAKGEMLTIKYGNNAQTIYTYGQDLRLSRINTVGAGTLQDLNYVFNKNGNITTLTDNLRIMSARIAMMTWTADRGG